MMDAGMLSTAALPPAVPVLPVPAEPGLAAELAPVLPVPEAAVEPDIVWVWAPAEPVFRLDHVLTPEPMVIGYLVSVCVDA